MGAIIGSRKDGGPGGAGGGAGGMGGSAGGFGGDASVPGQAQAHSSSETYSLFGESRNSDFGPDYTRRSWLAFGGGDNPEVNPYAAEQDRRYSMDKRVVKLIRIIVLVIVAYLVCAVLLPSPSYNVQFSYTFNGFLTCIQDNVADFMNMLRGYSAGALPYKLCTYAIYVFAGAALAITGAVYQGTLKNALASPTTLGVNSGATLGVSLFVLFISVDVLCPITGEATMSYAGASEVISYYNSLSLSEYLVIVQGRSLASLAGCFVVVGLVMLVSHLVGRGNSSSYALIICGQVVALVASSIVEFIRYYVADTDLTGIKSTYIRSSQAGAISSVTTPIDLLFVAVPCTIGIAIILIIRRKLTLLAFNDEEARSMGLSTERTRWLMVGACTFVTAIVLSFCGNVGFVGFSIPLIVRRYVGPDFNYLIPVSAAMGSLFLVVTYWFTDFNLFAMLSIDIPVSVNLFTSTIGLIMFVFATVQQRRESRSADWL